MNDDFFQKLSQSIQGSMQPQSAPPPAPVNPQRVANLAEHIQTPRARSDPQARPALVTAVAGDNTVTINLAGTSIPNVPYMSHVGPTVDGIMWVYQDGPDLIGIGMQNVEATATPATVFPGAIMMDYGTTAPEGWWPCDGRSTAGHPVLASRVGANIPNILPGTFPMAGGAGLPKGTTGGAASVTLTAAEMPAHNHPNIQHDHLATSTGNPLTDAATGIASYGVALGDFYTFRTQSLTSNAGANLIQNTGGGQPHENLPPFIVVNFVIKHD